MLSWDETYIIAKNILLGTNELELEFHFLKHFLNNEFDVELINADIYHEPVFKNLPPSLRLILDYERDKGRLPIKNEERKTKVGDVFINILKENRINKYQNIKNLIHTNSRFYYFPHSAIFLSKYSFF